jgi:serine/threonine-protein kinase
MNASPNPPTLPLAPITQVRAYGKYLLIRKLAEGGMAEIFLAKQLGTEGFERTVVIKRMLESLTIEPGFVTMFLDEARLAARLQHPNIVQITDLGVIDERYYICMEYLAGEDLAAIIRMCRLKGLFLPPELAAKIIHAACEGLQFAHEFHESGQPLNIVHRDVSPSNIIVTYQGTVKVVDFGIAKAETQVARTGLGMVKGKWVYMSPEQALGESLDRRSDLFSLGLTFFELLTGERVFQRDTEMAIFEALLKAQIPSPRHFRPDLPERLEAIVARTLARDPRERYPDAGALRRDLETFLSGYPSVQGGSQLGDFLLTHFGRPQMELKTNVPSLKSLADQGIRVPGLSPVTDVPRTQALAERPASGTTSSQGKAAGSRFLSAGPEAEQSGEGGRGPVGSTTQPTVSVHTPVTTRRRRQLVRRRTLLAALWGSVLLGSALAAALLLPSAKPPVPDVLPPPIPSTPPQEPKTPEPPSPVARAPEVIEKVAISPVEPPPQTKPATVVARPRLPPPIQLTPKDIANVVSGSRARLLGCFERHRSALPSNEGQVTLIFSIAAAGAVTQARVETPGFESSPLSTCIATQIKALRFPRHTDKEVTMHLPFVYRITE